MGRKREREGVSEGERVREKDTCEDFVCVYSVCALGYVYNVEKAVCVW